MGSDYSCFGNNTTNGTKTMDEYKVEDNPVAADPKLSESKPSLIIDPQHAAPIQGALKGFLTRKRLQQPLSEARENRTWVPVEKLYEVIEKPLTEVQGDLIGLLENKLRPISIEKPNDGVKTVAKPAVKLNDGSVYQGEWDKKGNKHGLGTLVKEDGSKVIGCFKGGFLEGLGRVIHNSGLVIDGEFKNGELNGNAKIQNKSGGKFDGELANGKLHGKGNEEWPDGTKYEGDYHEGVKHGTGVLKLADGSTYRGEFRLGSMEGNGELSYKNGNKYVGGFKANKMHGAGVFEWADGRKYEGEFSEDVKNGKGKMIWLDGKVYDGEWKDGTQHGEGSYTYKDKTGKMVTRKSKWESGSRIEWLE